MAESRLLREINDFRSRHSGLLLEEKEEGYKLYGEYTYSLEYHGLLYENTREIELLIPRAFPSLAIELYIKEIPSGFEHIYPNGSVCLATVGEILEYLIGSPTVSDFVNQFVNPFFFTLEYFEEYGTFPFGEREHGAKGLLSYYKERYDLDTEHILDMAKIVCKDIYRGHHLCFCGSDKKLRDCHGFLVLNIVSSKEMLNYFMQELTCIILEETDYWKKRKHHNMRHLLSQNT